MQENRISEKFYRKLGFDIVRSDDEHSVVRLGDFEIILVNMRDEREFAKDFMNSEKGKGVYVYIHVDNVDTKHQELIDQGFKPATQPRDVFG